MAFVTQSDYSRIVATFRAQPAHKRPAFSAAARELGIDRRTLQHGWEHGWLAARDPRRPSPLPPLKNLCAVGADGQEIDSALLSPPSLSDCQVALAPSTPSEAPAGEAQAEGAPTDEQASEPEPPTAQRPGPSITEPPNYTLDLTSLPPHEAMAELARREVDLEEKAHRAIRSMLLTSNNIKALTSNVAQQLYEGFLSPGGQARFLAYHKERPERIHEALEQLAKTLELASKVDDRASSQLRLLQGKAGSIVEQRHLVATQTPPPVDPDRAEHRRLIRNRLKAIGASASEPSNGYRGEAGTVIDVETQPVPLPEPLAEE